ncbi:MAG TPA: right-handed parallel beta-helix repeat-containing protein, partial [Planctomycetaceae bacterium]
VSHIELHDLVITKSDGNGINVDDGGTPETPSRHVLLRGIVVRDIGPEGNRDGIKLSGVEDFRVESCTVERWGERGSGIDMVGCRRGEVVGCTFRHDESKGDNGVQAKGGSSGILIRRCRFEHAGQRGVNVGGSTGLVYFRPKPQGYEAKDVVVEDCTFVGSLTPVAFVGVDGATVRHNTIYRPQRWGLRILQENQSPEFVPCRNGRFTDNVIAFRSDEMAVPVNIGAGTAPETFTLARNAWYCLDAPERSRPRLPIPEADGIYGVDPGFANAERGDFTRRSDSRLSGAGARAEEESESGSEGRTGTSD